jgi:serine protease Do
VEGLGFAIPINDVISMIEDIMTNGYVSNKAYLGATIGSMTQSMAQQYRYSISQGAFIYSVEEGGPAAQAGLKLGDVITKIDDTDITSLEDLTAAKKRYTAGDTSDLTVYREGQTVTVTLTWGAQPAEEEDTVSQATQSQNGGSTYGSSDMQDLFDYFFGQYGNRSRGSGTAS